MHDIYYPFVFISIYCTGKFLSLVVIIEILISSQLNIISKVLNTTCIMPAVVEISVPASNHLLRVVTEYIPDFGLR